MANNENLKKWTLISSSAICFALSFLFPHYAAEGVLFFLIPLFYLFFHNSFTPFMVSDLRKQIVSNHLPACQQKLYAKAGSDLPCKSYREIGFKEGFIWGLIFYTLYFSGLAVLLYERAEGTFRLAAFILFILYGALWSGIWFWVQGKVSSRKNYNNIINAIIISFVYFWFIDTYFFIIFSVKMGNSLQFPLLPLLMAKGWSGLFASYQIMIVLFCIISFQACIGYLFNQKKLYAIVLLCLYSLVILLLPRYFFSSSGEKPHWLSKSVHLVAGEYSSPWNNAEKIATLLEGCIAYYPDCELIFMPESSFSFPLNKYKIFITMWSQILQDRFLVIGAHRKAVKNYHNSLYVVKQCRITQCYDKKYMMPLTEFIPFPLNIFKSIQTLFLNGKVQLMRGSESQKPLRVALGEFEPTICSDLFLAMRFIKGDLSLICLANDSWFSASYIPQLMYLDAKLKALRYTRDILYISHKHGVLLSKEGNEFELAHYQEV